MLGLGEFEHAITVHAGGRDMMGRPTGGKTTRVAGCKVAPGNTLEDVQENADLDRSKATLYAPAGTRLARTDRVTVEGGPCAGDWELDGDPQYWHTGTIALLKKYGSHHG